MMAAAAPHLLLFLLLLAAASTATTTAWPTHAAAAPAREHERHNRLQQINTASTTTSLEPQISLHVNTTRLSNGRGEWVEVSWQGVSQPSSSDWVALLVPAGADPSRTTPARFKMAASDVDSTHLSTGSGRLRFRLINLRSPMQFVFFRGGLEQPVLAARSAAIEPVNPNEPLQRRLALTRDNTQMRVEWTARDSGSPVVKWGSQPGQYTHTTPASSRTYTVDEMCGPPANSTGWTDPGLFHSAVLEGLEPGSRYYYIVGDEAHGFTPEASFHAAPPVGPQAGGDTPVQLLALADLGQAEEDGSTDLGEFEFEMGPSLNTTGGIITELRGGAAYQLLMHYGDISYALGFATQWDNFMSQVEPITSRLPYMLTHGNHERDWPGSGDRFDGPKDSAGECGVPLERRFTMPQAGPDKPWYSFNFGPIHFLVYSTEHEFAAGSEQHTWILSDLAAVDRQLTPWIIAGGHRPFYISSTNTLPGDGDQVVAAELRAALEEAFVQHKVDLTLHGHHHSYQRTCPTIAGKCVGAQPTAVASLSAKASNAGGSSSSSSSGSVRGSSATYLDAGGPVHLVIGNAGAALSLNVEPRPAAIWQTIRLGWGYLRIEATSSTLKCELVSDRNGRVLDALTLIKSQGPGRQQQHPEGRQRQQQWPLRVSEE